MSLVRSFSARACLVGVFTALTLVGGWAQTPAPESPPKPPVPPLPGQEGQRMAIPDDLLGDEHVREEFGVNQFTTPSIRKLFEMLDGLGKLSYDALKRPISRQTPSDRVLVSLGLGTLIADGFLIVQCEKVEAMEDVGRALIKYAKVLGTGSRMNRHTQSLFEHSIDGQWDKLRTELALTQADVEAEMVQLRDVDIAHLVSLGGWLRAFEIATRSVHDNYTPEKTLRLMRKDIAEYYLASLEHLSPRLQANESLKALRAGFQALLPLMDVPQDKPMTQGQVKALSDQAAKLASVVTGAMKS
ncbi:hypothetical protein [Prosthecobacter dejongeii]|uniref:Uncharacterized protein n=1 Tax=Prosthecobacter dejongeii TaxID=48465 RepID=A0A7W7YJH1_9BACT|nr:hypothetical protein [Prosthecobacter dejongeii]MBB5037167.1 hypothetical protein [Prosthecobacter dejongeii]